MKYKMLLLVVALFAMTSTMVTVDEDTHYYNYSDTGQYLWFGIDWLDSLPTIAEKDKVNAFDIIIPKVIEHEGTKFVDDKSINEVSKMGITLSTYRAYYGKGNKNSVRNLTEVQATAIYKKLFWEKNNLDTLVSIGYIKTAMVLMDSQINIGPVRANKYLQQELGVKRSGKIDEETIKALRESKLTDDMLYKNIITERRNFYARLVKKKPVYAKYHRGWKNRLDSLSEFVKEI